MVQSLLYQGRMAPAIFAFSVAFCLNVSLPARWTVLLRILERFVDGCLPFVYIANGDTCVSTFAVYNRRQWPPRLARAIAGATDKTNLKVVSTKILRFTSWNFEP